MRPDASAVITTYNQGRFVCEAVDSALAQENCRTEVIVVDDGSDDTTAEILSSYTGKAQVVHAPHRGVAAARNTGWRLATASKIAFLDGDDWWLPQKLRLEVQALDAAPDAGIIYSDTMRVRPDRSHIDRWAQHMKPVTGDCLLAMLLQNRVHTSTVMMRREVLEELGGFDECLPSWEDVDLWTRTAARYPFAYLDEVLAFYRMHGAGVSHRPMDLAHGRLRSTVRLLSEVNQDRIGERDRLRVMADVFIQKGVAHYLQSEMALAQRWLRRAWKSDPKSILRHASASTYVKSLAGPHVIEVLRRGIRPMKVRRSGLAPTRSA